MRLKSRLMLDGSFSVNLGANLCSMNGKEVQHFALPAVSGIGGHLAIAQDRVFVELDMPFSGKKLRPS
ncbi:hypothetical protein [Martelella mediterranea]|uniref:hypothetical protein n=1 Tax=Martelella mediterranea TaxID=293089 RepID=UPI00037DA82C|nr:hypothetical protein [Martelella mediterranea]